jgi:hypothetical protein
MPINFAIKLIATVALEAMQMGLQASKHTYGPRLSETQMTTADYGTPLPRFKGERRFAGQIVWSRDLEIVDHTTKVKGGGKQTNQSALWTGGVAFSDCRGAVGPIDKVLKIWLDETLAYDATGVGPISYASSLGFDLASVMRIYLGTDDQAVDPAYADYCEERYGPNSAPAFRGTAMLVFDRMPLDNFGNRAPQISVLAVSSAADAFPYETKTTGQSTDGTFAFAPGGGWMAYYDQAGQIEWWDVATRTLIGNSPAPGMLSSSVTNASLLSDGTAYISGETLDGPVLSVTAPLGAPELQAIDGSTPSLDKVRAFSSSAVYTIYSDHVGYALGTEHVTHLLGLRDCCEMADGSIIGVFQPDGASSSYTIEHLAGGSLTGTFTATSRSDRGAATICHVAGSGHLFVVMNGHFYLHDDSDLSLITSGTISSGTGDREAKNPNLTSFWDGSYNEYSLVDGSLIRTIDPTDFIPIHSAHAQQSDPVDNAIWERPAGFGTTINILYLDRAANAGVTLGTIISAMCTDAGLEDRDTSLLTQTVLGYSWTRGDVKSQMEPLLDIHDVDACPHDFTLKFLPRGSAPSGTIVTADFAKNGENPRYKTVEAQDTDLPKLLRVNFSDTGFDQQTNNILSPLPVDVVDSQNDVVIDLTTSADTPTGAQQKGDRYMRRTWNGRDTVELSLTARYRDIEPGVVMTLDLDGIQWNAKLEKQTFVGGVWTAPSAATRPPSPRSTRPRPAPRWKRGTQRSSASRPRSKGSSSTCPIARIARTTSVRCSIRRQGPMAGWRSPARPSGRKPALVRARRSTSSSRR